MNIINDSHVRKDVHLITYENKKTTTASSDYLDFNNSPLCRGNGPLFNYASPIISRLKIFKTSIFVSSSQTLLGEY